MLLVIIIIVFLKSTTLPCPSVKRPSSKICKKTLIMRAEGWSSPTPAGQAREHAPEPREKFLFSNQDQAA